MFIPALAIWSIMQDLFLENVSHKQKLPLAVRMRPESLQDFSGQKHLLGPDKFLRRSIEADRLSSLILYGPPGVGKTSLGFVISKTTNAHFVILNAAFSNVSEIKKEISQARARLKAGGKKTVLFIDEFHRLTRSQQDVLIPDTETGTIVLVGATTNNPFFFISPALTSRSAICELKPLYAEDIKEILLRALADKEKGLGMLAIEVAPEVLDFIALESSGDARTALTALEIAAMTTKPREGRVKITLDTIRNCLAQKNIVYDRKGDYHYDTISAFIKSVRGSDVDSALYWLAKMLTAGEDPRFICRRLVILSAEDIGLADTAALVLANAAYQAVEYIGMPEARIVLSEITIYLAKAPKSNAAYKAIESAMEDVQSGLTEEVPQHLQDSHYKSAEKLGRGKGYKYPHNYSQGVYQEYRKSKKKYYQP